MKFKKKLVDFFSKKLLTSYFIDSPEKKEAKKYYIFPSESVGVKNNDKRYFKNHNSHMLIMFCIYSTEPLTT